MTLRTPAYITNNRLGIFVFQIRIPRQLRQNRTFFRKSLGTRNRNEAVVRARRLWLMFDEVKARFFDNIEMFNEAMKVLGNYDANTAGVRAWDEVESHLTKLDSYESVLLERAIEYRALRDKFKPATTANPNDGQTLVELQACKESITQLQSQLQSIRGPSLDPRPLSALIAEYLDESKKGWSAKNTKKNLDSIKPKLDLIIHVVGDVNACDFQRSDIVRFKNALLNLPKNRTKGMYANKTIAEILELDIPDNAKLSGTTLKSYLSRMSMLLQWMAKNNYAQPDLHYPLQGIRFDQKPDHEQRSTFTDDELRRLFESKEYTVTGHRKASHYWVPLLALFTGARQSELCQLYKSDIRQDDESGIWYIDINQEEDKSIKKSHHARMVPIHKQLIKMGFLDYVKQLNHPRLFPDLIKKRDGYGQRFSRWFCDTYLNEKNCAIRRGKGDGSDPVFHSFRHTVETKLDHEYQIPSHHIAHLVGQKPDGKSVTVNRYIKPKHLRDNRKIIDRLSYPSIDFSKIMHWKRGIRT